MGTFSLDTAHFRISMDNWHVHQLGTIKNRCASFAHDTSDMNGLSREQ